MPLEYQKPEVTRVSRLGDRAIVELLTDRAELVALLRSVEWGGYGTFGSSRRIKGACPTCGGINPDEFDRHLASLREWGSAPISPVRGHRAGCRLAAFVR